MKRRTKIALGTLATTAFAIGLAMAANNCAVRARVRGEADCRQRGGRVTETHGGHEGWSCTFPESR